MSDNRNTMKPHYEIKMADKDRTACVWSRGKASFAIRALDPKLSAEALAHVIIRLLEEDEKRNWTPST